VVLFVSFLFLESYSIVSYRIVSYRIVSYQIRNQGFVSNFNFNFSSECDFDFDFYASDKFESFCSTNLGRSHSLELYYFAITKDRNNDKYTRVYR